MPWAEPRAKDSFFPSAAQRPKEHWGMRAATCMAKHTEQMLLLEFFLGSVGVVWGLKI
jgi:hypothetical protein